MGVRFLYTFKNDIATITSSSESGSLIDDNVVDDFVQKKWRTTGDTAEWIKFNLGSAKKITAIALFGHNLTNAATITLEAHASDAWGAPTYTKVMTWGELCIIEFIDQTFQWWRITIADAANPDTYIEIGRICMGEYIEPGINITHDVQKSWYDPSLKEVTEGRQVYVIIKTKYREYSINYDTIDRTLQDQIETLFRAVGNTEPFVFVLDPTDYPEEDTIYCLIVSNISMALSILANGSLNILLQEQVS